MTKFSFVKNFVNVLASVKGMAQEISMPLISVSIYAVFNHQKCLALPYCTTLKATKTFFYLNLK
jgi:hypothetical protein